MGSARRWAAWAGLLAALPPLGALPAEAGAAEQERGNERVKPQTRRVQAVREWATRRLEKSFEALEREDYQAAREPLDDMRRRLRRLNDHEEAIMWQAYGYVFVGQSDYRNAARALERALGLDAMSDAQTHSTRFDLGQLYMLGGHWDKAIDTLLRWYSEVQDPPPNAEYMIALAFAQKGQWQQALAYAKRAVEGRSPPRESWLQLLLQVQFELGDKPAMLPVLEQLIELYPRKTHWLRLYGLYSELGEEKKALAALEVAYADGLLTRQAELVDLARLYAYHELPYRSAVVLQTAIDDGSVEPDPEIWELLANSWLQAREYERAIEPLSRAAASDADGDTYLRLAQVQIERHKWSEAEQALSRALEKGGLQQPGQAHLLLGIAHFSARHTSAARRAFERARQYEGTREVAIKWLEHVGQRERLREAGAPS